MQDWRIKQEKGIKDVVNHKHILREISEGGRHISRDQYMRYNLEITLLILEELRELNSKIHQL